MIMSCLMEKNNLMTHGGKKMAPCLHTPTGTQTSLVGMETVFNYVLATSGVMFGVI